MPVVLDETGVEERFKKNPLINKTTPSGIYVFLFNGLLWKAFGYLKQLLL